MVRITKPPAYRRRIIRGKPVAYLTLRDRVTKRGRDFNLGQYGSDFSRERYARLVADWEAHDRRLLPDPPPAGLTVMDVVRDWGVAALPAYSPSERCNFRSVLRVLCQLYGQTPAAAFGPKALALVRSAMITGDPAAGRKPWARKTINDAMHRVRRVFRWAVAQELLPEPVYRSLCAVQALKRGQARETEKVRPVPEAIIAATLQRLSTPVRAMVELQRVTGMRSGELIILRTRDLEVANPIWIYRPAEHKTLHRDLTREVYLGPRAQVIARPWLRINLEEYLFCPADAAEECFRKRHVARKTAADRGNEPGTRHAEDPQRPPGERYTPDSYRRAIERACDQIWPPPANLRRARGETRTAHRQRLGLKAWEDLQAWRRAHRWHPHQLRHNFATDVRRRFGVEAARVLLGHQTVDVTEIYAERDAAVAAEVAKAIG